MATMPPQKTLPADQQAMQDGLATNAQAATDVANLAVGTRDITQLGVGTANFGSRVLTGKNLISAASMASRFNPPVLLYSLADYGVSHLRDDGKGLSQLIGEGLGGYIGNKMYGAEQERLSQPITQEELDANRAKVRQSQGLASAVATPTPTPSPTIIDSDPLTEKARDEFLAEKEQYDFDNATMVDSDPMTPEQLKNFQSEMALANAKPNPLVRIDSDPMTPENIQNIQDMKGEETLARMRSEGPQNLQEALTERYGLANADGQSALQTMPAYPTGNFQGDPNDSYDPMPAYNTGNFQGDPNDLITNLQGSFNPTGQMGIGIAPQVGQLSDEEIMKQRQLRALEQRNSGGLANAYGQGGVDPRALQFAGGGMRPDGIESYSGITASGNKLPIDKETLEAFQKNQESQKSASGLMRQEFDSTPIVSQTPEAGLTAFEDASGNIAYGNETARQMYSADAIEQNLSDRFKAEQAPESTETPLGVPLSPSETPTPPSSPEESPAPEGTPDEEKTAEQLEYEREMAEDDAGLAQWGKDNNKSPEYMEKLMKGVRKRRKEAEEEKKLDDLLKEIQLEKEILGNIRTKQLIEQAELPEGIELSDVKSYRGMMEDMGLSQDPVTGAITINDDGFFGFGAGQKPLSSNSSIFYMLNQSEAGRHILNMTPPEINTVENPDSSVAYPTKDGRFFTWNDADKEWNLYLPTPASANPTVVE